MKSVYELKRFKSAKHPDLLKALKLYTEYTEPALRTDTKEIMYCIDFWNENFDDPFYVLGFYYNELLIGFCELAYFTKEKFVIVDYLVIQENYRKNNTFYQFVEEIRTFLENQNIQYSYIVAEVACYNETLEPPESSKLLIKLLKMSQFGVVKCNYYVPKVDIDDFESTMRSVMMIYSLNKSNQIKKETFFQIVDAIYHKYYQRWHNLFVDETEKDRYANEIEELKSLLQKELKSKNVIDINGLNSLFPVKITYSDDNLKNRRLIKTITAAVLFAITFTIVGALYLFLKSRFEQFDASALTAVFSIAFFISLLVVALIFDKKSNIFSNAVEKLIDKF